MESRKKIEENDFYGLYFNPESQVMEVIWKLGTSLMRDQGFRDCLKRFVEIVRKYSVKGFFVDTRESRFTIAVDTQTWHDEVVIPEYIAEGLKKMAFVVGDDLLSNISHEQTFEEPNSQDLEVQFFEEAEEALAWLESDMATT